MKEKVIFVMSLIGSFSAMIILLINQALVLAGIDTSAYVDIINIVGIVLSVIILIVAMVYLNKYNVIQQKQTVAQNNLLANTLESSSNMLEVLMPTLAEKILSQSANDSKALLLKTEEGIKTMMQDMLPELANQTMQVVTQQSQNIVNETTAKAIQVMNSMDELLPTYAKQISDSVAQTVRENNTHYQKMLVELKALMSTVNLPSASTDISEVISKFNTDITANMAAFEKLMLEKQDLALTELMNKLTSLVLPVSNEPIAEEPAVEQELIAEDVFTVDTSEVIEEESTNTQNDEIEEKSDETETA